MIHTSFYQGSKVRLIFKDGSQIIAKYLGHKKGKKIETDKGIFNVLDLRATSYYKPLPHERN